MHDDHTPSPEPSPDAASADLSGDAPTYSPWQDTSDGDLVLYTRAGDGSAYGELWRRHARAGRTVARSFTSSLDPDDLVQESFAKIYQALQKGGGPTGAFRPYLFTTIRNTASAWGRARREASIDTLESFEDPASRDEETMAALDRSLTATAFRSLPTRWQEVLWYCEVEQMTPQQVAPLLAMKPNAVAALAYRAREGLRQAWIQAHIAAVPEDSDHRWTIERIGSYTRGSLGKRDTSKIEAHLDGCARCTIVAAEAKEVGSRIALVLLPLAAGTAGATGYLAWMQTGSHAALTTAAMPAAVIGGHGMSLGTPIDPSVLASLGGTAAGGTTSGGAAAGGTSAGGTTVGGAGSGAAVTTGAASAGTVTVGAATTGIVSGVVALVAAGAVAAAIALSPSVVTTQPQSDGGDRSIVDTSPTPGPTNSSSTPGPQDSDDTTPGTNPASSSPGSDETSEDTPPSGSDHDPSPQSSPSPSPSTGPTTPGDPDGPTPPTEPTDPEAPGAPTVENVDQGSGDALYPILRGRAEPGASITVRRGDEVVAEVLSDADGAWETAELRSLPTGESEITVEQKTDAGTSVTTSRVVTMRSAPTIVDPVDGGVLFVSNLSVVPGAAFPNALVAGSVDGQPIFTCQYDATGTVPSCAFNDGADWISLGLGWHTITVAYTDGLGRVGPSSDSRVFVAWGVAPAVLEGGEASASVTAGTVAATGDETGDETPAAAGTSPTSETPVSDDPVSDDPVSDDPVSDDPVSDDPGDDDGTEAGPAATPTTDPIDESPESAATTSTPTSD